MISPLSNEHLWHRGKYRRSHPFTPIMQARSIEKGTSGNLDKMTLAAEFMSSGYEIIDELDDEDFFIVVIDDVEILCERVQYHGRKNFHRFIFHHG